MEILFGMTVNLNDNSIKCPDIMGTDDPQNAVDFFEEKLEDALYGYPHLQFRKEKTGLNEVTVDIWSDFVRIGDAVIHEYFNENEVRLFGSKWTIS